MPKKQGFYSTGIVAKKANSSNPFGTVALGSAPLPTVPEATGKIHGLGAHEKPFRKTYVKGSHGFGHLAKHREGHLRLSGMANPHRLGGPKVKKPAPKTNA
jgi:hypothetical protein